MQIKDFQSRIEEIYFARDSARGLAGTHMWFCEEVGELTRRDGVGAEDAAPRSNQVVGAARKLLQEATAARRRAACAARGGPPRPRPATALSRKGALAAGLQRPSQSRTVAGAMPIC